jgi:hypothetical protein
MFAALSATGIESMGWMFWGHIAALGVLLLYLVIASHAGRLFVDLRRNGLLELLAGTALTAPQIVRGQWRALLRMFGPPLALCLLANSLGVTVIQYRTWSAMANTMAVTAPAASGTNSSGVTSPNPGNPGMNPYSAGPPAVLMACLVGVAQTAVSAANFAALAWFGMWMGLTSKNNNFATLKAIVFVQVIPWFVLGIGSGILTSVVLMPFFLGTSSPMPMVLWYPFVSAVLGALLFGAKDVAFIVWSRRRLFSRFRQMAIPGYLEVRSVDHAKR